MKVTDKEHRIQAEFQKLLPGIIVHPARSGNNDTVNYSHYSIHPENLNLIESKYSYKGKLKFIHFSSLFAIQSILTNKNIRLYNLHNLNDPREYSFAGDLVTFNSKNKEDAKRNMYLLSMCKTDILSGPAEYEYNMWRLYGQNGSGVCIQFDFSLNPQKEWRDYFLSEIFYGAKARKNLKEVSKLLAKYENETPKTVIDLGQIVTFHKSNLYKLEKEVRLLFDCREKKTAQASIYSDRMENQTSPIIDSDITKSVSLNKEIKYLELPIYHIDFKEIYTPNKIPIPKIEKLILGHSYKDNFDEVAIRLSTLAEKSLGYKIKVELSRMAKYYYDK